MADDKTLDANPDDTALIDSGGGDDKGTTQGDQGSAPDTTKASATGDEKGTGDTGDATKPDTKTGDAKPDAAGDWPADWRDKLSGGDAKVLSRLSRYASPKALADALLNAQNKLASTRPILGKDATPEQIKEYREALGVPETADKYDLADLNISDKDKPLVDAYLAKAHATNQTPEQVRAGIESYMEMAQTVTQQLHEKDAAARQGSEDALRGEWGNDFRRNISLINSFLDNAPQGLKDKFLQGRLADGTPIGSDPDTLRWILQMEMERNPTGTVVPGAGANMAQSVDDEIKKIETFMSTDRKAYNKDEKMQQRYRDLLEYRIAQGEKGKKAA